MPGPSVAVMSLFSTLIYNATVLIYTPNALPPAGSAGYQQ